MASPMEAVTPRTSPLAAPGAQARFATDIVFAVLASLAVALRVYCRFLKRLPLAADDWAVIIGLVFLYGFMVCDFLEIFLGYSGHHITELINDPEIVVVFGKTLLAGELVYPFSVTGARISLNLLFIRVFNIRVYRRLAYANIALNVCWCIYSFVAPLARCTPVAKQWNPAIMTGSCASLTAIELVIPIFGIVCDIVTWVLPLPMVWRLQMSLASRIGLTCIFALGLVVMAIGGARIATIFQQDTTDITHGITTAAIIAFVEPALAIVCACGPLFRPAMDKAFGNISLKNFFSNLSFPSMNSNRSKESHDGLVSEKSAHMADLQRRHTPGFMQTSTANASQAENERETAADLEEGQIGVKRDIIVTADNHSERTL